MRFTPSFPQTTQQSSMLPRAVPGIPLQSSPRRDMIGMCFRFPFDRNRLAVSRPRGSLIHRFMICDPSTLLLMHLTLAGRKS